MLSIIPTLMVLPFFFNSRFLQTGILQTGPNQFGENQKQNQDKTGRFDMKNLPKRLELFLTKRLCRNVLFPEPVGWAEVVEGTGSKIRVSPQVDIPNF